MELETLREDISRALNKEECGAEFYFLLSTIDGLTVKRADLDQSAQSELSSNFIESVSNSILLDDDISLIELSSADDRKGAIYRYDLDETPEQLRHLSEVLEREDFSTFDFTQDELAKLKGIIVLLGHGKEQLVLYKHQYPIALFKRDTGL